MGSRSIRCSLIVLNYEGEDVIEECVESLLTAKGTADELKADKFTIDNTDDADGTYDRTVIRYGEGQQSAAQALAGAYKTAPPLTADPTVKAGSGSSTSAAGDESASAPSQPRRRRSGPTPEWSRTRAEVRG